MTKDELFNKWNLMYENACNYMNEKLKLDGPMLIEVSAQHPLIDGLYPNKEFVSRLTLARNIILSPSRFLYDYSVTSDDIFIYVPGGRHKVGDIEDKVSLSDSGITWLNHELPLFHRQIIGGDKKNLELTDGRGIFNGEDECLASSRLFEELKARKFISICSQGQMMRKALAYIQLGYYPNFLTVPGSHHNPIWEVFYGIPRLIETNQSMPDEYRESRIVK